MPKTFRPLSWILHDNFNHIFHLKYKYSNLGSTLSKLSNFAGLSKAHCSHWCRHYRCIHSILAARSSVCKRRDIHIWQRTESGYHWRLLRRHFLSILHRWNSSKHSMVSFRLNKLFTVFLQIVAAVRNSFHIPEMRRLLEGGIYSNRYKYK